MFIPTTPREQQQVVESYREQARAKVPQATPEVVEQTALQLFEKDLARVPTTLTVLDEPLAVTGPSEEANTTNGLGFTFSAMAKMVANQAVLGQEAPKIESLADCSAYTANLAACLGGAQGALSPALLQTLNQFDPSKLFTHKGRSRILGDASQASQAAAAASSSTSAGVVIAGAWNPSETAILSAAVDKMHARLPATRDLLQQITVQTHILDDVDAEGKGHGGTEGLFMRSLPGHIRVARTALKDPEWAEKVVFHESGHELDRRLGQNGMIRTEMGGTPFGKTANSYDYVSNYARSSPAEDLAETHSDLLANWEFMHAKSDTYFYAQGKIAEKRRWILEQGYGIAPPPPSAAWLESVELLRSGQTPFGWKDESGRCVSAVEDFGNTYSQMMCLDPDALKQGQVPPDIDRTKLRWALDRFTSLKLPPDPPTLPRASVSELTSWPPGEPALEVPRTLAGLRQACEQLTAIPTRLFEVRSQVETRIHSGESAAWLAPLLNSLKQQQFTLAQTFLLSGNANKEGLRELLRGCPESAGLEGSGTLTPQESDQLRGRLLTAYQELLPREPLSPAAYPPPDDPLIQNLNTTNRQAMQLSLEVGRQLAEGGSELAQALRSRLTERVSQHPLVANLIPPGG